MLTRDTFFNNVTLANKSAICTAGFRLFVRGTLSLDPTSKVHNNGNPALGQKAGPGLMTRNVGGSSAGSDGGDARADGQNVDNEYMSQSTGGSGGRGGDGAIQLGGLAGQPGRVATSTDSYHCLNSSVVALSTFKLSGLQGGAGGSGGAGGPQGPGGGGGSGGGVCWVAARTLSGAGCIEANGGRGGDATNPLGGAGAGGGGGCVVCVYQSTTAGFHVNDQVLALPGAIGQVGLKRNAVPASPGQVFCFKV